MTVGNTAQLAWGAQRRVTSRSPRTTGATQGVALIALPVAGKLLLHPFIVWLALLAFGVDQFTMTVGVLTAALPTAGWVFIFAQRYDSDVARISSALVVSTALAAMTFSALVWSLGLGVAAK